MSRQKAANCLMLENLPRTIADVARFFNALTLDKMIRDRIPHAARDFPTLFN